MNFDSIRALNSGASLWQYIPDTLKVRYKTQKILMRADAEVLTLDREKEQLAKDEALKSLLSSLEAQLLEVELEIPPDPGSYGSKETSLHI